MIHCQLDFEIPVASCFLVFFNLGRVFTISCIVILLPWSQDNSMQENLNTHFLPNNSFCQPHVPGKSISCIQGEVKQSLSLLVCFFS